SATLTWQTLRIFITTRVFPQAPALTTRESAEKLHPGNQFDAWIRGSVANDLPGSWRPLGGGGSLARKCRPCYRIRKASKDCGRRLKPAATAFFIGGAPTVPPDCQGQYASCSAIAPRRLVKTARAAKDSATLATARQAIYYR